MSHRSIAAVAALALALVLVPAAAAGPAAKAPAFPVTLTAANGKVTVQKQPQRIVSLSPSATESLFAIGAGKQVVAVDDQSNYPASAPRTKLSGFKPNAEAIAAYKPDVVIVAYDANGLLAALAKLRIPVLLEPAARHLNEAYGQIRQLGRATGHYDTAAALVRRMRAEVAQIAASIPKRTTPLTVYHELGPDYYSATSSTFIGRIYKLLGLKNIADEADTSGSGYPQLSGELIVAKSPDVIVLSDTICCGVTPAKVAERAGWSQIAAVREGRVIGVSDDIASRWGPRIVTFMRAIAAKIARA